MSELPESSNNYFVPINDFLIKSAEKRVIEKNGGMVRPVTPKHSSDKVPVSVSLRETPAPKTDKVSA